MSISYLPSKNSFFNRHFVIMVPDWAWDFRVIPEERAEKTTSYNMESLILVSTYIESFVLLREPN